jgi:amidase
VPAHVLSAAGGRRQDQANADKALRFGQDLFLAAQATRRDLSELEYKSARAMDLQSAKERGLDAYMTQHKLDAVVFSSTAGASIAAKAGYPSVQVPPTGLPAL